MVSARSRRDLGAISARSRTIARLFSPLTAHMTTMLFAVGVQVTMRAARRKGSVAT